MLLLSGVARLKRWVCSKDSARPDALPLVNSTSVPAQPPHGLSHSLRRYGRELLPKATRLEKLLVGTAVEECSRQQGTKPLPEKEISLEH